MVPKSGREGKQLTPEKQAAPSRECRCLQLAVLSATKPGRAQRARGHALRLAPGILAAWANVGLPRDYTLLRPLLGLSLT